MSVRTSGEQVYQEFISRGERHRFAYEDVQILKGIQSAEELHQLCADISGETFPESASAREMLETCVMREPEQSDAEAVGCAIASGFEGCLPGIVFIPLLLLGVLLGVVLRATGLRLDILGHRYPFALIFSAVLSLALVIGLSFWLQTDWPLWSGTVSGLCCGIAMSQQSSRIISGPGFLAVVIPLCSFIASMSLFEHFDPLPSVGSALGIGTGDGMSCSPDQLFAKRSGAKIRNGLIVLRKTS